MGTQIARIAHRTVRLTNAQIKALPTTAIELVPDPGRSKVIQFLFGFASLTYGGAAYTNLTDGAHLDLVLGASTLVATPVLQKSAESNTSLAQLLAGTHVVSLSPLTKSSASLASAVAVPTGYSATRHAALNVTLTGNSGDLTGGHADTVLDITVYYAVVLRAVEDKVATPASASLRLNSVNLGLKRTYVVYPTVGAMTITGVAPTRIEATP